MRVKDVIMIKIDGARVSTVKANKICKLSATCVPGLCHPEIDTRKRHRGAAATDDVIMKKPAQLYIRSC